MDGTAKRCAYHRFPRSYCRRRTGHSVSQMDGPSSEAEKTNSNAPSPQPRTGGGLISCEGNIPMHEKTQVQGYRLFQSAKAQMGPAFPQSNMIEGKTLRESRRVPGQHCWVESGTMLLSGRSFIWANKLRIGGMPTNCRREELPRPVRCARVQQPCASVLPHN